MGFFDDIVVLEPAPVCPECGTRADKAGAAPGRVLFQHDRGDQAMLVGVGNPCPGAGKPSVSRDDYVAWHGA
jgi:hypothetical protein